MEVDQRGRVSLGRLAKADQRRYLGHTEPDGTVILVPAVVMSELEARFLANPRLVERVERNRREPEGLLRRRQSDGRTGRASPTGA